VDDPRRRERKKDDMQEVDDTSGIAGTTQEICISDALSEDTVQVVLEAGNSVPADSERNAVSAEEGGDTAAGPDMSSVAEVLGARLERVWEVLGTATAAKIEMVIKYTSRSHSYQLEEAVQCWEDAAAAILAHERAMRVSCFIDSHPHSVIGTSSCAGSWFQLSRRNVLVPPFNKTRFLLNV
jgi:hypothetical protein